RSATISWMAESSLDVRMAHTYSPPVPARSPRSASRHSRKSRRGHGASDRLCAALTGADPHDLFDRQDRDLAVADLTGRRGRLDRTDCPPSELIGNHDLDPHLAPESHLVLGASVDLGAAGLPTAATDAVAGPAPDPRCLQGVTDVLEPERLDVDDDQPHFPIL